MSEEQTEMPATDEPNAAADGTESTSPADAPNAEISNAEISPPADVVEAQSDEKTEDAQVAVAEQGSEHAIEDPQIEDATPEDTTATATEDQTADKVDDVEGVDQEQGSEEAKPEEATVVEGESGGDGDNDGTNERKEETEGTPNREEETKEDDGDAVSGSQPDPEALENPEQVADGMEVESTLPESSTFTDGERPETPLVAVIDPLSREGSPVQEPQFIPPGTPERQTSPVIEYEEYDDEEGYEEQMMTREELVECYQAALTEREQLQSTNTQFQHKLAEYFKKKKTDDQRQEMDKNVTDQEQRYLKYMSNLEELRRQEEEERESLQDQEKDLSNKKDEKLTLVDSEMNHFSEFKKQTALNAINSRTGKAILPKDVEQYLLNEVKKEDEVKQVRLDNIKLKNRLKKREQQLKAKEELAEGLHLIDFEQLKIENQTYNEKIEERNEELLKLRKKITSTVQVLTHVKEKLQFVQAENQVQKSKLRDVEEYVGKKRDVLSRTKKARDKLRIDNQRQMQKCGLLGNKPLLRDFEERKDEGDDLRARLEYLKRQHAELTLDSNGLRRKIEEAKSVRN